MPVWDNVNAVNTPTAYKGISRSTFASNAQINSRGQPGQDHHAVRMDQAIADVLELTGQVAVASHQGGQPREPLERRVRGQHQDGEREHLDDEEQGLPLPSVAGEHGAGDRDITDAPWLGVTAIRLAQERHGQDQARPRSRRGSAASARHSALGRGRPSRAFEIASTPVSADEPTANADRITRRPSSPLVHGSRRPRCWGLRRPFPRRPRPWPKRTMNPYVGTANRIPDSRRPRRFATW